MTTDCNRKNFIDLKKKNRRDKCIEKRADLRRWRNIGNVRATRISTQRSNIRCHDVNFLKCESRYDEQNNKTTATGKRKTKTDKNERKQ
jgi:hypothetical protein